MAPAAAAFKNSFNSAVTCTLSLPEEAQREILSHVDFPIRFTTSSTATQDHGVIAGLREILRHVHEWQVAFRRNVDETSLPGTILCVGATMREIRQYWVYTLPLTSM